MVLSLSMKSTKFVRKGEYSGADVSREGVQRDLLR